MEKQYQLKGNQLIVKIGHIELVIIYENTFIINANELAKTKEGREAYYEYLKAVHSFEGADIKFVESLDKLKYNEYPKEIS